MRRLVLATLGIALAFAAAAAQGQAYPSRPLRIVSPFTAGGPNDVLARIVAEPLSLRLGQRVLVDNKPGAGGTLGAAAVAQAPADGYTLVMLAVAHTANETLYPRLPYRLARDLQPVVRVANIPLALAVRPGLPVKNLRELVDYARARPGTLSYASGGNGTSQHLAMEQFRLLAGLELTHVPYRGLPQAYTDMLGGRIDLVFAPVSSLLPYLNAGTLRALAVATGERLRQLPQLPTFAQAGFPGLTSSTWHGLAVPAGTPSAVVQRLHAEVVAILANSEIRARLLAQGAFPAPLTPAEFADFLRAETALYARLIAAANIQPD